MKKTYQVSIDIIDSEYKDMLIMGLIHQGYQVFFDEDNKLCTIMSDEQIKEIDFNQAEENTKEIIQ